MGLFEKSRDARFLKSAFSEYVSPETVDLLVKTGETINPPPPAQSELTFLVVNLRNFMEISEKINSQVLSAFINRYLTLVSDAVMAEGGMIDKFVGDKVFSCFGVPTALPLHAVHGMAAALACKQAIDRDRDELEKMIGYPVRITVGLSSGSAVAGILGGNVRKSYTIIGNPVLRARDLEQVCKEFECEILLDEGCLNVMKAQAGQFVTRDRGEWKSDKREKSIRVFELVGSVV